ncbi:MAG: MerR family transcriptional regulator [Myxococcota bacterium]
MTLEDIDRSEPVSLIEADATPYSLGAVVRLTGLTAHTLRAWERRYGAVAPARTPRGTRRYSREEVSRLRLLRSAVDAGHRISDIAQLSDDDLELHLQPIARAPVDTLSGALEALEALDAPGIEQLLTDQLDLLGPSRCVRRVILPLMREVGDRWARGEGSVEAEHLLSSTTRALLGVVLRNTPRLPQAPQLLFSTPEGEPHEFGSLCAAVIAAGAGAAVTYLGPNLPVSAVIGATRKSNPIAVALGVVTLDPRRARAYLRELRASLPDETGLWVGGAALAEPLAGIEALDIDTLERRVARAARSALAPSR